MNEKFYITTPIYYINDVPHIGHAYTTIAADVVARFHKSKGDEVFFLTGTDEHGAKIAEAASNKGMEPKAFVDSLVGAYRDAWEKLGIQYSEFFRTTDTEHEKAVTKLMSDLVSRGYIEKRKYSGLYCVGCERYYQESELADGKCPDHQKELVSQEEENYFFLLSKFQNQLEEMIESNKLEVMPVSRKNEILGKIRSGLEDVSVSRAAVKWGIPFPGDDSQTIYVWFDALLNYYTASEIYGKQDFWPPSLQLMAKDILWFHAIIWPAMLLALDLPLPEKIFAHGFFTINGQKMSKSLGNVLDPVALADKYGPDAVRYALLREFPFGEDGDISEEKIRIRYEKDLSNELGNLLQRTISMINRYEVKIDKSKGYFLDQEEVRAAELPSSQLILESSLAELKFDVALSDIWRLIRANNVFIEEKKPWELAKNNERIELERVLNVVHSELGKIAELIECFMPKIAPEIKVQLESLEPTPLFPRLEDK